MDSLQQQGRAAYKGGDFAKALALFDRAIARSPSVQLLDNRAACHDRMGKFSSALKDAKAAIQLHREDPTGYLRAGKVLTKMEKPSVALEIYAHGLKCVKPVGLGYELLRKAHVELQNQLSPPSPGRDPLTVLPPELAQMVLQHLTFKQRMVACMVSKQWARYVRSDPSLWNHLDLSGARRKVRNAFISRAINAGRYRLTRATLRHLYDFDKALSALAKHCPLNELTVDDIGTFTVDHADILRRSKTLTILNLTGFTEMSDAGALNLFTGLSHQLQVLVCQTVSGYNPLNRHWPKLRSLSLRLSMDFSWRHVAPLGQFDHWFPALESLHVQTEYGKSFRDLPFDLAGCRHLQRLTLDMPAVSVDVVPLPPSLRSVVLYLRKMRLVEMPATPCYLPLLERLDLRTEACGNMLWAMSMLDTVKGDTGEQRDEHSEDTASVPCSQLKSLTLTPLFSEDVHFPYLLRHPRLQALDHLAIPSTEGFDDDNLGEVVRTLRGLKSLDVSQTDVTGVGIREVVNAGTISTLNVSDCRFLGIDAVQWARSQGMQVQYKMATAEGTKGRKVRQ